MLSKTDEGKLPHMHLYVGFFNQLHCTVDLRHTGACPLVEFTDKLDFCKEFCTQLYADTTVLENKEFRGLIFSIY